MKKFNNKKAFKIKEGSTEAKTIVIFPKKGQLVIEGYSAACLKPLLKALQIAFEQGYDKALLDRRLIKEKKREFLNI